MPILLRAAILTAGCLAPLSAGATQAKIDADTCTSLRLEQIKFRQSGILDDLSKGAAWAKANLSADRLREIEHYLQLDEQVKFGCRDAKLSPEAEKASEAAARIEINSDADPTAPIAKDPPKPGAAAAKPAAEQKTPPKKAAKKKAKPADDKSEADAPAKTVKSKQSNAAPDTAPQPPVIMQSQSEQPPASSSFADDSGHEGTSLPAFGFGEMSILPHTAP